MRLKKFAEEICHIEKINGVYEPDWIYRVHVVGRGKTGKVKYYFGTVSGVFNEIRNEVDTVIAFYLDDSKYRCKGVLLEQRKIGN